MWGFVSVAKCVCTVYRSSELVNVPVKILNVNDNVGRTAGSNTSVGLVR